MNTYRTIFTLAVFALFLSGGFAQEKGYYRFPSVNNDWIVFTA